MRDRNSARWLMEHLEGKAEIYQERINSIYANTKPVKEFLMLTKTNQSCKQENLFSNRQLLYSYKPKALFSEIDPAVEYQSSEFNFPSVKTETSDFTQFFTDRSRRSEDAATKYKTMTRSTLEIGENRLSIVKQSRLQRNSRVIRHNSSSPSSRMMRMENQFHARTNSQQSRAGLVGPYVVTETRNFESIQPEPYKENSLESSSFTSPKLLESNKVSNDPHISLQKSQQKDPIAVYSNDQHMNFDNQSRHKTLESYQKSQL